MSRIAFLGDVGVDRFDSGEERVGGCSLHAARAARRAGAAVDLLSVVGSDAAGARIFADEPELVRADGKTAVQRIRVGANGERELCGYDAGVLAVWRPNTAQARRFAAAAVVHTVAFAQIMPLFDYVLNLPRRGALFVDFMDLTDFAGGIRALAPYWDRIDGAFFGLTTAHSLDGFAVPGKTVVVTLGAAGSRCFHAGEIFHCLPVRVNSIRDTTGAGDTYAGTFLADRVRGASIPEAMAAASAAAGRHISLSKSLSV